MPISRRCGSALALAALIPVLAACGSDDDGPADSYKAQLKKVCEQTAKENAKIEAPTKPDPAALRRVLTAQARIAEAQNRKLRNLKPPEDLEQAHDEALGAAERTVALFSDTAEQMKPGASQAQLQKAARPLQSQGAELRDRAQAALKKIGVQECIGGA